MQLFLEFKQLFYQVLNLQYGLFSTHVEKPHK